MPGNQDYSIVVGNGIPFGADSEFAQNKVVLLGVVVPADTENTNLETIAQNVKDFLNSGGGGGGGGPGQTNGGSVSTTGGDGAAGIVIIITEFT